MAQIPVELEAKISQWLEWDKCEETREELVKEGNVEELQKTMGKRIAFGTAGLRGKMRAGWNCMNHLTVRQASQGLCAHVLDAFADAKERGVIIGYDGRFHSEEFARISASVFLSKGIPVQLFSKIVPTPYVAFGVKHTNSVCGIIVTASHNPKDDNGYKVFWDNTAQINSPVDGHIFKAINENLKPWAIDDKLYETSPLVKDCLEDVESNYMKIAKETLCWHRANNATASPVVYTAMHGVGTEAVAKCFKAFNLPAFIPVKEQVNPDPTFPTVEYPNPEEGAGALELSMKTAEANGATVILANDPDADRLAVAEHQKDGSWRLFNGNELGCIFGAWMWDNRAKVFPGVPAEKLALISTAVSSKFLKAMADKEGCVFRDTLTGFKFMGNLADEITRKEDMKVLLAYEEAIGFMLGPMSLDKDGVRAAAMMAEMVHHLKSRNLNLAGRLDELYDTYGYHYIQTKYFKCELAKMSPIFKELSTPAYPTTCGEFKIRYVRDLVSGLDTSQPNNKATLPLSSTPMVTFTFENGTVATLRGSGTEPKLKYYVEVAGKVGQSREEVRQLHAAVTKAVVDNFLQPEKNNLV